MRFVIETNRDITERKRAEEALRRSEAYLAEAQRLSKTGSFSWRDPAGERYWSDECYRIFGYDRSVKPALELFLQRVHPEDRAHVQQTVYRAFQEGADFDYEHRLLMPDGSVKYLHNVARATRDASGNLEFIGALMDVTDTKRALQQLQQAQAELARITRLTTMGQLAASIAHEINQPLTGVVTNAHTSIYWLADEHLDLDKARNTVQRIVRDGQRASDVIARIRGLMTKSAPQIKNVDMNGVINEVLALTDAELRMRGVGVRTELAATLPPVKGDRVQLQQVVLNLVTNAIDAMASVTDGPRLLQVGSRLEGSGETLIFVRDHGTGLDPATADKIFTPFFTTKPKGIGMGLAICRSIVESHGGRLWASPATPHGAIFQFTLPTKAVKVA
jgi:two-component system sensor kinase FixL